MNLLFPNGRDKAVKLSDDTYRHLALDEFVHMAAVQNEDIALVREIVSLVPTDVETVGFRQEIFRDFLEDGDFVDKLEAILKKLDILKEFSDHSLFFKENRKSNLWNLIDYMEEMEVYIDIIESLTKFFDERDVKSEGLRKVASLVRGVTDTDRIDDLKAVVNSFRADISTVKSITLGVNLGPDLQPEEINILDFNIGLFPSKLNRINLGASISSQRVIRYKEHSRLMEYMCADLEKELGSTVKKTKAALREFINLEGYFLLDICKDLKFYLLMTKLAKKIKATGQTICFPKIDNTSKEVFIKGIYNIRLIDKGVTDIVKNDFSFTDKEKIYILTGPNRGGKTVLTQGIGIIVLMAAEGMFVTADSYEGFLFDNILTHFPADENMTLDLGRLGEEAVRIQQIVKEAGPRTLVLLNETYSSTSASDGLYMAKDLVHILKHKSVPTIFNTHIHELARSVDEMNDWDGNGNVVSVAMQIVDNVNTFKVVKGEPDSRSYAKNIALKYGVTYEQMLSE